MYGKVGDFCRMCVVYRPRVELQMQACFEHGFDDVLIGSTTAIFI